MWDLIRQCTNSSTKGILVFLENREERRILQVNTKALTEGYLLTQRIKLRPHIFQVSVAVRTNLEETAKTPEKQMELQRI